MNKITGWKRNAQRAWKSRPGVVLGGSLFNTWRAEIFSISTLFYRGKVGIRAEWGFSQWPSTWVKLSRYIWSYSHRSPSLVGWGVESPFPWLAACHSSSQSCALPSLSHPESLDPHWSLTLTLTDLRTSALVDHTGFMSGSFRSLSLSMEKHHTVPGRDSQSSFLSHSMVAARTRWIRPWVSPGSVTLYSKALALPISSLPENKLVIFSVKHFKNGYEVCAWGLPADGGFTDP